MATTIDPSSIKNRQQIEAVVSSPDGANRLFILTGTLDCFVSAGENQTINESFIVLLGPQLGRREFHRAVATVSLSQFQLMYQKTGITLFRWEITDVDADRDDESSQVQLRFEVRVSAGVGFATIGQVQYHVTVLAEVETEP